MNIFCHFHGSPLFNKQKVMLLMLIKKEAFKIKSHHTNESQQFTVTIS